MTQMNHANKNTPKVISFGMKMSKKGFRKNKCMTKN